MLPPEASALSSRTKRDLVIDDKLGVVRSSGFVDVPLVGDAFSMSMFALAKVPSNSTMLWASILSEIFKAVGCSHYSSHWVPMNNF